MSRFVRLSVLAALVGVAGLLVSGVASGLNPQPLPPRLLGVVRDACSGLPVAGATVTISPGPIQLPGTPGAANPGPVNTGPLGGFSIPGLTAGSYDLVVEADGYTPVGKNPGPAGGPAEGDPGPIQVTINPGPVNLPAGEAVNETLLASVLLAPSTPGANCTINPGPVNLPALTGQVRNANTGLPILGATETLTPTTGEKSPGPPGFGLFGLFAWGSLDPGGYQLNIAARRYVDPGPIQVTRDPGPVNYPDGAGVAFGENLDIQLLPAVQ